MSRNPLASMLRHPRRLGFIAFNLVVVVLLAMWGAAGPRSLEAGLPDFPNSVLGYVGIAFLLATWAIAWAAWGIMVLSRRRRLKRQGTT